MTWDYPDPFTLPVAPLGDDIDHFNHTNNAVYIQWCERVGWGHSEVLGLSLADYQRLGRAMVIRQAAYDYLLPTVLHEELTLGTWLLGSDGKLAMQRGFQIRRNRDGATVLRGRWELVCVELSTGRPRRMPPEFCEIYLPAIAPKVATL